MYIIKNAQRNVLRSKGRSILIGLIVMLIAFSVCIGLCIRQSSSDAEKSALENLNITAQIIPDRQAAMEKGAKPEGKPEEFDKGAMRDAMKESLSLNQLKEYAEAKSVKSFYYTLTLSLDGKNLEPFDTTSEEGSEDNRPDNMPKGQMNSSDFEITGYSSDDAMTEFTEGTCKINNGEVFEEGTEDMVCIISDELAEYNSLKTGDTIKLVSPDDEDKTCSVKICGIYTNSSSSMSFGGLRADPANNIFMSYAAAEKLSKRISQTGKINGTYVLGDKDAYDSFTKEVKEMGLEDGYAVSSSDISAYERNVAPLTNLSGYAKYFLIVIIGIGIVVLGVLNIFSTRERKYEIGVLTAIGMKKSRVATMFVSEILMIAIVGTVIGGGLGAAVSVPVTEKLMAAQTTMQQQDMNERNDAFGREPGGEMPQPDQENAAPDLPGFGQYMSDISSSVDVVLLLKVLLCCILLAAVSGLASVTAIMRCEPLDILTNRD